MNPEERIRELLHSDADSFRPSPVPERMVAERVALRRRRRRRSTWLVPALTAIAAVVVSSIWWWPSGGSSNHPVAVSPTLPSLPSGSGPCVGMPGGCGTEAGSAARLSHGSWKAVAAGPLGGRDGQVAAWTGRQFVVWGGTSWPAAGQRSTPLSDGASYDPVSGRWQSLPPAPISGRQGAAAVWDGSTVFIWGGQDAGSGFYADGATYDPARGSWARLPPSPLSSRAHATALWTGSEVIIVGGYRAGVQQLADGAAYSPATKKWTMLPSIPSPVQVPTGASSQLVGVSAGWTGGQVVVVATYELRSSCGTGCTSTRAQFLVAGWVPGGSSWKTLPSPPQQVSPYGSTLTWTGHGLVVAGGSTCLPGESCPAGTGGTAGMLDLSGTWTVGAELRPTPTGPQVWTGRALVVLGAGLVNPSATSMRTDLTQVYDPSSNAWRAISSPSTQDLSGAAAAWTGTALLVWSGGQSASGPQMWTYQPAGTTPPTTGPTSPTTGPTPPTTGPSASTTAPPATNPLQSVNWSAFSYPLGCPGNPLDVWQVSFAQPSTGKPVTAVLASCKAGAGTPPEGLFVYSGPASSPHLDQTLISWKDNLHAQAFTLTQTAISIAVTGYSSSSIPRYAPDVAATLHWSWDGKAYQLAGPVPSHAPLCGSANCPPTTSLNQ